MAKKFKRKIITFQSFVPGDGVEKDEEPCDLFDDLPDVVEPREVVLRLLAGGQAQDFARRQVYYDPEEFEDYKAEYGCDYIQQYHDYLELKKSQSFFDKNKSGQSGKSKDGEPVETGSQRSGEPASTGSPSVVSTPRADDPPKAD